jgi:hypothetical protein
MFRLSIHLVNEAMKDNTDAVAECLERVSNSIYATGKMEGTILDSNGNTVGHYRTTSER